MEGGQRSFERRPLSVSWIIVLSLPLLCRYFSIFLNTISRLFSRNLWYGWSGFSHVWLDTMFITAAILFGSLLTIVPLKAANQNRRSGRSDFICDNQFQNPLPIDFTVWLSSTTANPIWSIKISSTSDNFCFLCVQAYSYCCQLWCKLCSKNLVCCYDPNSWWRFSRVTSLAWTIVCSSCWALRVWIVLIDDCSKELECTSL